MASHRVRIPMLGSAESLNVVAAAAICLYQSARHPRGSTSREPGPIPALIPSSPVTVPDSETGVAYRSIPGA
jgi:hypothetical protein